LDQTKQTHHDTFSGHKATQEAHSAQNTYSATFSNKPVIKRIVFTNARNLTQNSRDLIKSHNADIIDSNKIKKRI
jgi:hypothetical protein